MKTYTRGDEVLVRATILCASGNQLIVSITGREEVFRLDEKEVVCLHCSPFIEVGSKIVDKFFKSYGRVEMLNADRSVAAVCWEGGNGLSLENVADLELA